MPHCKRLLTFAALCTLAVAAPLPTLAQAWPAKPVTLVVPFPPGGGNDLVARQIAPGLQQVLGQPVVVENRPGAGGTLGVAYVTKAAPDGYTLSICATGNVAVAPALYSKLSYGVKDLVPVSHIVNTPTVWVGAPDLPAQTLKDFIALARSQPGKFNFASSGNGTTPHLAGEALKARHGLDMQHVPYKGTTPAYTDIGSGRVSLMMDSLISALPLLEGGGLDEPDEPWDAPALLEKIAQDLRAESEVAAEAVRERSAPTASLWRLRRAPRPQSSSPRAPRSRTP